ncbi:MAG: hypothetical protein ACOCXD_01075 [Bacteroidota bacterium]
MMKSKRIFMAFLVILFLLQGFSWYSGRVSLHVESKKIFKGKVVTVESDIYYSYETGNKVTHYTSPEEFFFISNNLGEVKIYYPGKNQVVINQGAVFSNKYDDLHFFLNNRADDMGLREMGFKLEKTEFDNSLMISSWYPPVSLVEQISKIELVHEEYIPIYMAHHGPRSDIIRKVYYSDYHHENGINLPTRITEIEYVADGDSIVTRKQLMNLRFGGAAISPYFNFRIPDNAELIEKPK